MTSDLLHPFASSDASGRTVNGLNSDKLIALSRVEGEGAGMTAAEHTLMMLNSIDMTGDEGHALGVERVRKGYASVGIRSMLSRPTLGDALIVLSRYFAATSSVFSLDVARSGGVARISLRARGKDLYSGSLLEEIWFNALYAFACWFVGKRIPIRSVAFAMTSRPDLRHARSGKAATIAAGDATSIEISADCLAWERAKFTVQEPVWEAMSFWLYDHAVNGQEAGWLRSVLHVAEAPAKTKARDAVGDPGLSDRQLARRLQRSHGAGFRQLRSGAIMSLAEDMLRSSTDSIETIAGRLGYSEERSFRRFVRAQTGLTPTQLRMGAPRVASGPNRDVMERIHALTRKIDV